MDLVKAVIENTSGAMNLVKTFITTPILINTDTSQGMKYAIPLEVESYQEEGNAEVSESLVITTNRKTNVADNVAPGSMTWTMSGYIPGDKSLEPTNYFTPIVRLNTDIVRMWFKRGAVLIFKDANAQIHEQVVIKSLKTSMDKDCQNKTPFSMTLKEINVMENGLEDIESVAEQNAMAEVGSALGPVAMVGTTAAALLDSSD